MHSVASGSVDYVLELGDWPLAKIYAPVACDPADLDPDSFYRHTDALLARETPFALLYDLRNSGGLSAARRKRFVDYVEANHDAVCRYLVAYASLVDNELQRGVLTAVLWILKPPSPQRAFTSEVEARVWLNTSLTEFGVELPRSGDLYSRRPPAP